tara:strand:+ start:343 stop:756 length:414 start_codon:yes stop_codon:yes gene_type:complete
MGANGAAVAPTYQQAGINLQKDAIWEEYGRQQQGRNQRRDNKTFDLGEERAYRAFPGQYNRRGMLDSGQYQRGGRELASALMRQRNMNDADYMQATESSRLRDALAANDLETLRGMLTSEQYQNLVASMISGSGGAV